MIWTQHSLHPRRLTVPSACRVCASNIYLCVNSVSLCAACKRQDISSSLMWLIFSWAFDVWFAFCSESLIEPPKTIPLPKNSKKDRKAMSWTQLWSLSRDPCTLKPNKRIKSSFKPGFHANKKTSFNLAALQELITVTDLCQLIDHLIVYVILADSSFSSLFVASVCLST